MKLRHKLQGMAALYTKLARMDGFKIDKKACNYRRMADYMMHVGRCGGPFNKKAAQDSLEEAVSSAIVGDPMNTPKTPVDSYSYKWMESS